MLTSRDLPWLYSNIRNIRFIQSTFGLIDGQPLSAKIARAMSTSSSLEGIGATLLPISTPLA